MKKKLVLALMVTLIMSSFVACGKSKEETKNDTNNKKVVENVAPTSIGKWSIDYTKDEVDALNKDIVKAVKSRTEVYGLKYDIIEKAGEDKGRTVKEEYIYTDNVNPEPNRLASMYYGYKVFEENLSSGQLTMKIGFNLDKEKIKENGKFDFAETSIAAYSEAFTGEEGRDYSELNKKLYSIISGESTEKSIENDIDGLKETILITDDYLLYILDTKEYQFAIK